jgi:hypothetical protein
VNDPGTPCHGKILDIHWMNEVVTDPFFLGRPDLCLVAQEYKMNERERERERERRYACF